MIYYGVLATRARWRAAVVALAGSEWSGAPAGVVAGERVAGRRRGDGYLWAELMRRTFGIDVLECPRCGRPGRRRGVLMIAVKSLLRRTRCVDPVSGFVSPRVAEPTSRDSSTDVLLLPDWALRGPAAFIRAVEGGDVDP